MVSDGIRDWHAREWNADYGLDGARMVMGCTLWSKSYVDDFLGYCAPSLRANRLDGVTVVLFVDGPTERLLVGLELGAARVQIRRLPEPIVQGIYAEPVGRYPLLAAAHNLLIHQAGRANAGFHMLVADAVYSERYFERLNVLRLYHQAIAHTGFEIIPDGGLPALDTFRRDGVLAISAADLGALGWKHFNPQWASWTMDGVPDDFAMMPNSYYIHWRGQRSVRIHCAHQSAAWIGPERCRMVTPELGGTVDSEMPRYMAGDFYTPRLEDDMVYIVIANPNAPPPIPVPRVPFEEFKAEFWRFIDNRREFLPYYVGAVHVPVPVDPAAPSDAELDARLAQMMARLEEGR